MEYQEGDIVLCTVERIESNTTFVKLPNGKQGTLIISEIAPGRIKNLREYVVPNKKIACKIMRISSGNIDVSLRRVTSKERSELLEKYKQEQQAKSALNQILKEKAKDIENKILQSFASLYDFTQKARENPEIIEKYIPSDSREAIKKIIQKKQKNIETKKLFSLKSTASNGILMIKKLLENSDTSIKITYLAAGHFQIIAKAENYKLANQKISLFTENLEKQAKTNQCEFSIEEK